MQSSSGARQALLLYKEALLLGTVTCLSWTSSGAPEATRCTPPTARRTPQITGPRGLSMAPSGPTRPRGACTCRWPCWWASLWSPPRLWTAWSSLFPSGTRSSGPRWTTSWWTWLWPTCWWRSAAAPSASPTTSTASLSLANRCASWRASWSPWQVRARTFRPILRWCSCV